MEYREKKQQGNISYTYRKKEKKNKFDHEWKENKKKRKKRRGEASEDRKIK